MSPQVAKLILQLLAILSSGLKATKDRKDFEEILDAVKSMVDEKRNPRGDEYAGLMDKTSSLTERLEKRNKELSSPDEPPAVAAPKTASKKPASKRRK